MKNIILIIFAILLTGCVPVRKDGPAIDAQKVLTCPDLVESAAKNLEKLKIDPIRIQAWKKNVLSNKTQPCSSCQKLNIAAYVLNDVNDVYKPAMLEFIKDVEKEDPNRTPAYNKPYISGTTIDEKTMGKSALAQQYLNAIEDLQNFLITEIKMPVLSAKNLVLDNYFVPLVEQVEKVQDPNQVKAEIADPNTK